MKKKIVFVVISTQYFYKYISLKSFKQLEKNYKVYYLFNEKKLDGKNIKIKNRIFYRLNKRSSVWTLYLISFLRIANHHRCRTFKAATDWYYPGYRALKQLFRQNNLKNYFFLSYLKILLKKLIINAFSMKFLSNFMGKLFYKNIKIEDNLDKIFSKYKPDLLIYPTHSWEPEVIKLKKLSDTHRFKTFYIIDNWDNLTTKTYYKFKPDFIGVWSPQIKKHAISIQDFKDENIFLIGSSRFDNYFNLKKKDFKKINQKYILFLAANIRVDEGYYLELLNRILRKNKKIFKNTKIIYRQHPQAKHLIDNNKLDDLENVIIDKTVFTDNQVPYFKNNFNLTKKNYIPLLLNSEFITGCATSIVIEGLIFNKSYLVIAFEKKKDQFFTPKWSYQKHIHYEGLEKVDNINISLNEKHYEKMVIEMFKKRNKKNNFFKNRRQLKYFYYKDKLSYDKNILQIVNKILAKK